jgi:hypothetical protein
MSDNPVYRRLRQIYCTKGAEFCRPELEQAWLEIDRLERALVDIDVLGRNKPENGYGCHCIAAVALKKEKHNAR